MKAFSWYFMPFILSVLICAVLGPVIIPVLRRIKAGQSIRSEGPDWHKVKQGTPVMGGLIFIIAVTATVLFYDRSYKTLILLCAPLMFGGIGFLDDFIKVVLKRNLGLRAWQKFSMQIIAAIVFVVVLKIGGLYHSIIYFPFTGISLNLGWLYTPFVVFIMVGFNNAVNLTDGVDGLATSVTAAVSAFFFIAAKFLGDASSALFFAALTGGCIGFLIFNHYPAKVFMGDTGSLYLGGAVAAGAVVLKMPLVLVFVGIIYVAEVLSVMIQVVSFKLTGKRVFKMSPLHHHFEMCGYSEIKIVTLFTLVTIIACAICIILL